MARPLRTGDLIRLASPGYGEPSGECAVIADQRPDGLVWFTDGGEVHVARRQEVRLIQRNPRSQP